MSEPMRDPMRRQLTSGRRITPAALLPGAQSSSTEISIPGHLCEVCLDAPAARPQPAPWGGEMGVCAACAGLPPAVPAATRDAVPACVGLSRRHSYKWLRRFVQGGLEGLHEQPRHDRRIEPLPPELREQPNTLEVG